MSEPCCLGDQKKGQWCVCVRVCVRVCVCRSVYSDCSRSVDDGGRLLGMLWGYPGVSLHAGAGENINTLQIKSFI